LITIFGDGSVDLDFFLHPHFLGKAIMSFGLFKRLTFLTGH